MATEHGNGQCKNLLEIMLGLYSFQYLIESLIILISTILFSFSTPLNFFKFSLVSYLTISFSKLTLFITQEQPRKFLFSIIQAGLVWLLFQGHIFNHLKLLSHLWLFIFGIWERYVGEWTICRGRLLLWRLCWDRLRLCFGLSFGLMNYLKWREAGKTKRTLLLRI